MTPSKEKDQSLKKLEWKVTCQNGLFHSWVREVVKSASEFSLQRCFGYLESSYEKECKTPNRKATKYSIRGFIQVETTSINLKKSALQMFH
ncbi:hypothetical protein CEXT_194811 [Caerostris extrusa]|uniref:LAGLIDADG homing endonuclease n=1 Tax=Caerostris extrusa TaxID=172846 RepID=A0AAV4MB47_CAEEX|nr:hypothetical protein CEXT_194811 [Caerostris extrusa]